MSTAVKPIPDLMRLIAGNLRDLGMRKLKAWRHAYRAHKGLILGCAALGGFLVAHHFASKTRRVGGDSPHDSLDHAGAQPVLTHIRDNVSQIQTALVNVAAAHAKRLLGKWIPGFADHLPDT